jgi:DNA-binding GntR family transcriptional regulator
MLWPSNQPMLEQIWRGHEQLLAALKARDADGAERLMREHLEQARVATLNLMMPVV